MALTADGLARLRRLIGDTGAEPAFSEGELDTIYTDNGEDLARAIVECLDVLLADAAKRVSYRQGQSFQDDNKLFEHLLRLRALWLHKAGLDRDPVESGALTYSFYDKDGTDIPDESWDDVGWMLN